MGRTLASEQRGKGGTSMNSPIFLRAHTEALGRGKHQRKGHAAETQGNEFPRKSSSQPKWPEAALVIDCETTTDARQALTFGSFRYCRVDENGVYNCVYEGLFHADDLEQSDPEALSAVQEYAKTIPAETPSGCPDWLAILTRSEFIERVFWQAVLNPPDGAGGLVVGFNLPFDLSRLAVDCRTARRRNEGWSLVMSMDNAPITGMMRINPLRHRIKIKPKDSKAAFIRLAGVGVRSKTTGKRIKPYTRGRFLDLRTLAWALRNQSYSLENASKEFGVPGKLKHEPTGRVTLEEIEYCRQDVRATVGLLNALRTEFDRHPIDLQPDQAYSPASIAKAYLKKMGIAPPPQKFDLSPLVQGAAMQAYYGGRAECRIRQTVVPVVHTDFLSEYPTANTLMGLWRFLTAERLRIEDSTDTVRRLLANVTPASCFDKNLWKDVTFYALVRPMSDVLPVRTVYNGKTTNIGVNPLTSDEPVWYAGPDVVAATLLNRRPPEIVRAIRIVPEGQQEGLRTVALRGAVDIDPTKDDFFKKVIEARSRVKSDNSLPEAERKALGYFLKILANAGSYGLFVEVNPDPLAKGEREKIQIFSGDREFKTTSPVVEELGRWYCPLFAALITAAGRLLLALLERSVEDAGGSYLLCDTDSMAIVASKTGGLVACGGGPNRFPDGREAVKALSFAEVHRIVDQFRQLNPYYPNAVPGSILKIEDVNYRDGIQREIFGYAIAAKRYALFAWTDTGDIEIVKASAHGLGFLYPPKTGYDSNLDVPLWVVAAWNWILRGVLSL